MNQSTPPKGFLGRLWSVLRVYLLAVGILFHIGAIVAVVVALQQLQLTPVQAVLKTFDKANIEVDWLVESLRPAAEFADQPLLGQLRHDRPRILDPATAGRSYPPSQTSQSRRLDAYREAGLTVYRTCERKGMLAQAACWAISGDVEAGLEAIGMMSGFQVGGGAKEFNQEAWELAFAYDLISGHPALDQSLRSQIVAKLIPALVEYLALLDADGPSLWHRRTSHAAKAWLVAVTLDASKPQQAALIARAQRHFLRSLDALSLVEAWPEGYNYWIQNRALLMVLASSAWLRSVQGAGVGDGVRSMLDRVGLWHVYATRPDGRIEGYGDEGSRIDLKDETRRVIDLIAQLTRSAPLATYSRYLESRHGAESYYRGYRWQFELFNDPNIEPLFGVDQANLSGLERLLPLAGLFGRGATNHVYIRSGWRPEDTFISFRAGQIFTHHQHYDAGHFSLFKREPLVVNSSTYGHYFSPNRLYYSIRTVAKNSLLILRPGETAAMMRLRDESISDGGQRPVLPTGSAIRSVEQWQANLGDGHHYEGGEILEFAYQPGEYAYVLADLTAAYDSVRYDSNGADGKVVRVLRSLLYLYSEDRVFVHDRVTTTRSEYLAKWLLHVPERPNGEGFSRVAGVENAGILQSRTADLVAANGDAAVRVQRLWPRDGVTRIIGGPGYRYYVETDGDDSSLDGRNFADGAGTADWFDKADWRIELQHAKPELRQDFLVTLAPGSRDETRSAVQLLTPDREGPLIVASEENVLVFLDRVVAEDLQIQVPAGQAAVRVFGLSGERHLELSRDGRPTTLEVVDGVVSWIPAEAGETAVIRKTD